jgi:2-amino-4-hydroxy-6-hydroxymethyldihydropteridine diphosphokinase
MSERTDSLQCEPEAWVRAYVGIGSNLDEPVEQVRRAVAAMRELPQTRLVKLSSLYRSAPLGGAEQPDYINAVAVLDTRLGARKLLAALHEIEAAQGRDRSAGRWASRTLDLDLLVYGDERHAAADLTVPHPGIGEREFVLHPLNEVAPDLDIPGLGPVAEHARRCALRGLVRLADSPV